jgi:hypothetical protein
VDGPALDRAEQDERLVLLDQLARVGLGLTGLVVVVQRLEHDLAAVHAAAAVDQVQVGLDAVLHRHAVVVLATLQRDVLADQELVLRDTIGGHGPRQGQGQAAGNQAGQEVFHDRFSFRGGSGDALPCRIVRCDGVPAGNSMQPRNLLPYGDTPTQAKTGTMP